MGTPRALATCLDYGHSFQITSTNFGFCVKCGATWEWDAEGERAEIKYASMEDGE